MKQVFLAVIVAAVVVVGSVGIYFLLTDDDANGDISIIDGSGTKITLSEPINSAIAVNVNVPKAMKILGLEDKVAGLSFSPTSNDSNFATYSPMFPNAVKMSDYNSMSAEQVASITKYVICPVASMTVSAVNQTAFEQLGITVIRLDCNGESALDDFQKLITLFGNTEESTAAFGEYMDTYNTVVDAVISAASLRTTDPSFLMYMNSSTAFYNQTSELSAMIESIHGTNALRGISGLNLTGVTNAAGELGIQETIKAMDSSNNIDKIFIRATAAQATSETTALNAWNACLLNTNTFYSSLSAIGANSTDHIFLFNTNIMSGPLSYVGYVLIAKAFGISTGFDATGLIDVYNQKYGFDEQTTGLLYTITITGGTASAQKLV
jgi:hypothetical protein